MHQDPERAGLPRMAGRAGRSGRTVPAPLSRPAGRSPDPRSGMT